MVIGGGEGERAQGTDGAVPRGRGREERLKAFVESSFVRQQEGRVPLERVEYVRAQGFLHEVARRLREDFAAADDRAIVPVLALPARSMWVVSRILEETALLVVEDQGKVPAGTENARRLGQGDPSGFRGQVFQESKAEHQSERAVPNRESVRAEAKRIHVSDPRVARVRAEPL